jgi:hypothetical protein
MVAWLLVSGLVVSSALAGVHQCVPPAGAAALDSALQTDPTPDDVPTGICDFACRCACHNYTGLVAPASPSPTDLLAADLFPVGVSPGRSVTPSTPRRPPKL